MTDVIEPTPTLEPTPALTDPPAPTPTPTDPPAADAKPADKPVEFVPLAAEAIVFPEGFAPDPEFTPKFVELANEMKLSPEAANKLVALQAEITKKGSEAATQLWLDTNTKWQDTVKADAEIGGTKLTESLAQVGKLLNSHGSPELREALNITGAGNHPAVVKFLYKMAKELNEGGALSGSPASAPSDAASLLYPTQGKS